MVPKVKNAVNFVDTGGLCSHVHSAATDVHLGKHVTVTETLVQNLDLYRLIVTCGCFIILVSSNCCLNCEMEPSSFQYLINWLCYSVVIGSLHLAASTFCVHSSSKQAVESLIDETTSCLPPIPWQSVFK